MAIILLKDTRLQWSVYLKISFALDYVCFKTSKATNITDTLESINLPLFESSLLKRWLLLISVLSNRSIMRVMYKCYQNKKFYYCNLQSYPKYL